MILEVCLGWPLHTLFWALTISWSRLLARVWRGPYLGSQPLERCFWQHRMTIKIWSTYPRQDLVPMVCPFFLHKVKAPVNLKFSSYILHHRKPSFSCTIPCQFSIYNERARFHVNFPFTTNELLGAKGSPLVGEEVRKKDVGKVGSW